MQSDCGYLKTHANGKGYGAYGSSYDPYGARGGSYYNQEQQHGGNQNRGHGHGHSHGWKGHCKLTFN